MKAAKQQTQSHFILVHGGCHGAWCWYKLKPLLESHGHKVTVLDLAASGINMKKIEEVPTFYDYTVPLMKLMESLPLGEKVILVGHSFGGMSLALAMDKFPEKISVAVFLTAFMPDTVHKPSFVIDQYFKGTTPESWLDTKFESCGTPEVPRTSVSFGPKYMASKLYQLCPIQMGNNIHHLRLRITKKEKDMEAAKQQTQSHFILIRGGCHGAWCWYKLKPLLESHGHKVTVLDLAASGINLKKIEEVPTLYDYTVPLMKLMESLPLGEMVILVGHGLGGMNLALVMDKFPEKICVTVFLTAFMPDIVHKPSFVINRVQLYRN
ncbi:Salicylic acid-binding protein 2 [Camellia lanceoleosa]|uniref:Salicylic acid-binding protein 2 n=1 Tax=Camellia lanceoleosa TaxID=1840588 RepID=A0ACC0GDU9_9ERIC|nr:Salicylic acid-binding protein 2 [Camellia lanceoleosa]